ncbi:ATP-binding protein [Nocardia testacea]|uniref:ATP-binding protein n=1 Tax=Nocardia testacea TaxID=248551 RepID=UPI003A87B311
MTLNSVQDAHGRECLVVEVDLDRVPAVQVRADVRRVGRCAGIEVSDAVQVSDELVSNACRRARSPRTCRLLVNEHGRFRIEVHDSSPAPARIRGHDHTGGRGLLLVTQLATRWGTEWCAGGKTVWAELDPPAGI